MRRTLMYVLASILLGALGVARSAEITPAAVNAAGEQRMLSQRLAKAYVQVGLDVMPGAALDQLRDSVVRFERNLDRLRPLLVGVKGSVDLFERMSDQWQQLRIAVDTPASATSALDVSRRSVLLLASADGLTNALERASMDPVAARRVNVAGRQRMLSQRIVKAYLLHSWGVSGGDAHAELVDATREFDDGLRTLAAMIGDDAAARRELEEIALQWEWLKTALEAEGAVSYRLVVAEASDSILEATERLTKIYEKGGAR